MRKFVLLMLPLLASAVTASAQAANIQSFCDLVPPQTAQVFDWTNWRTAAVKIGLISDSFQWDASHTIWQGYSSPAPFDQPHDASKHWSISLDDANGGYQWIYILDSRTTPTTDYVYVFDKVQPSTAKDGSHYGVHPCRVFAADGLMIERWIQAAYNFQPN